MKNNKPQLTIGMAMCRNLTEVKFTVQALRMMHAEVLPEIEIIICDNAPEDPQGKSVRGFIKGWTHGINASYVEADEMRGTAWPRDKVFREAKGEWCMCIDSHVMFPLGVLRRFIDWTRENSSCRDLVQGPMVLDDFGTGNAATHMQPTWGAGMRGQWATDPELLDPNAPPKEIELHGLGMFACRTDAWPGFNHRLLGFGGEEGYIHEKFRQRGDKAICLPFLRWWHYFRDNDATPAPYCLDTVLRVRNYLITFNELGRDWAEILTEFAGVLSQEEVAQLKAEFGDNIERRKHLDRLARPAS